MSLNPEAQKMITKYVKEILEHCFCCRVCFMNLESSLMSCMAHIESEARNK